VARPRKLQNLRAQARKAQGELYTYIFGLDRMLEGSLAALATPAVGIITERLFKYKAEEDDLCAPHEAQKLGQGMFLVCAVAWSICFCFYSLLHCTYPKDRRLQQKHQRLEEDELDDSFSLPGNVLGKQSHEL